VYIGVIFEKKQTSSCLCTVYEEYWWGARMDKQNANVGLIYSSVLLSLLDNPDRTFVGAEAVRLLYLEEGVMQGWAHVVGHAPVPAHGAG
jgi:hypothetical protein